LRAGEDGADESVNLLLRTGALSGDPRGWWSSLPSRSSRHWAGIDCCPSDWSWSCGRENIFRARTRRIDADVLRCFVDLPLGLRIAWIWDAWQLLKAMTDWNTNRWLKCDMVMLNVQTAGQIGQESKGALNVAALGSTQFDC
jgi:hypothetical protein